MVENWYLKISRSMSFLSLNVKKIVKNIKFEWILVAGSQWK